MKIKPTTTAQRIDDLNRLAAQGRAMKVSEASPDFERNVARLRKKWECLGVPALEKLQAFIDKNGRKIESAACIDYEGMKRAGLPAWRVDELRIFAEQTRNFMSAALNQLSSIPRKIDAIQPAGERAFIHGAKDSDVIDYEFQSVLDATADLTDQLERIETQIAQLSLWGPAAVPEPPVPAEGGRDVN